MNRRRLKEPENPKNFNTRETKMWCRGKVGVEHSANWTNTYSPNRQGLYWHETLICSACGKHLDTRNKVYTLGDVVRHLRNQRGWTQTELGKRIDAPQEFVSQIELDNAGATLRTLRKLANAFDLPLRVEIGDTSIRDARRIATDGGAQ